jgi:monomeric sarcosine oxidase
MRVVVVGVGGVGSMAAWQLAAAGHQVTALEQFAIDHDRGSSYGESRIVRRVYPNRLYTRMMGQAYEMWDRLMAESGDDRLFVRCGGLFFGPTAHAEMIAAEDALRQNGVPYERLDATECRRRHPAFSLDPSESALFEPSMGYARASEAVRAAVLLARRAGAEVRESCTVSGIEPGAQGATVHLATGETLEADRVIISAGPWTAPMLRRLGVELPVTVTRQAYAHLLPDRDIETFEQGAFPVWIDVGANAYGFPLLGDVPGVKIGIHDYGAATSPESVGRALDDADRGNILAYAKRRFQSLGSRISYEKVCLYTVAPDNDFVIDSIPGLPQMIFISACSGHGFKFVPLMGRIAAEYIEGRSETEELAPFRAARLAGGAELPRHPE